jgi:UDP-glucose 4-epimerase
MATNAGVVADPVYAPARTGELARSSLDPGRAAIHLGWKPWTQLDQGTSAVLKWMAKSKPEPHTPS